MPKSTGKAGIGVVLQMADDSGTTTTYATIANVTEVQAGGVSLATEDATHLGSPDFYEEFIPTLKSAEEWQFTLQWDPDHPTHDGTTGLRSVLESREFREFRLDPSALNISEGIEVDALVTNLGNLSISPTGIITQQCTLRPSGAPRPFTPGV